MPLYKEAHDPNFLSDSFFARDSGICPKACYRNAAPAVLYEQVGLMQHLQLQYSADPLFILLRLLQQACQKYIHGCPAFTR
jgi:hypothetical protein